MDGQRRRFSTGETSLKAAQSKAAAIMADIKSQGFEAAIKLHSKRREEIPDDPTVDDFAKLYRLVITTADSPPSKVSSERYVRCLERVCEGAGVKRIRRLNSAAVERFKDAYIRSALPDESTRSKRKSPAKKTTRVPTRYPERISQSLPPSWIGKGFQNVSIALVADGADGFSEQLQALRNAPVQRRAIFLFPRSQRRPQKDRGSQ